MKLFRFYVLVLIISLLPFVSIFLTNQLPHTSDGGVQIPRMGAFYKAILDGHIPVRWAGDLNYGYGLPLFNFIYHTPFYVSTLFISLGFSLIETFKIVLALSFILSGIFMYGFTSLFFQDKKTSFFVTILYQFAPYRLVEILTRGSVGGIYAYTFLPLVLWFIVRTWKKPTAFNIVGIALSGGFMILSHNALALLFFACIFLFMLLFTPHKHGFFLALVGLIGSIGVSAYYWMPALLEHKYTYGDLLMKDLYRTHFPQFQNFFIPNIFNIESLRVAEINTHVGIIHTLGIGVSFYILFHIIKKILKNKTKFVFDFQFRLILYCFTLLSVSFFFMNSISLSLWERISLLRQFQFPWRFLAVIVLASSLLGSRLMNINFFRKTSTYVLLIVLIIIPTAYYWRSTLGFTYGATNQQFWDYPLNTTYFGETDIIWGSGPAKQFPTSRIEIIEGNAVIHEFNKITHKQTFTVDALSDTRLVSHTQFFPGWRVYVDEIQVPIEFQDQLWRGLITFRVPRGFHNIRIEFESSKIQFIGNNISMLSFIIVVFFIVFNKRISTLIKNHTTKVEHHEI